MRAEFSFIIAELAVRSPIIIQNSSKPSSRKNLDVRPYDRTRCYFNKRVQLYRGHANATALFSSPVVSVLGSELGDPVLVLAGTRRCALETCGKKKSELRF